ncbi:MAG: hypothetical protein R2708_27020 [Vicinamibacterales bacterium]
MVGALFEGAGERLGVEFDAVGAHFGGEGDGLRRGVDKQAGRTPAARRSPTIAASSALRRVGRHPAQLVISPSRGTNVHWSGDLCCERQQVGSRIALDVVPAAGQRAQRRNDRGRLPG